MDTRTLRRTRVLVSPAVHPEYMRVAETYVAHAGIELRITPSIWPWWRQVAASTLDFSGGRLANAAPHPSAMT